LLRKKVEQIAHDLVYGLQVSRNRRVAGAEPLKIIIEVRQIDQAQSRVMLCSIHLADAAIQREAASGGPCGEGTPAAGPQNVGKETRQALA